MSYTLDYDEPIPKVIARLTAEHEELQPKLSQIHEAGKSGDLKQAMSLLNGISMKILRHAVEEEARLMRVIMWELKQQSDQSISILRQHREIADFLKYRLPKLSEMPDEVARREIRIFVDDLKKHHAEEEKVVFPLALKADKLHQKRTEKLKAAS